MEGLERVDESPQLSVPAEMRAAVIREFGRDPEIETVAVPEPAAGEALVRVDAAGLCATDLKVISGALSASTELPRIPGHEVAGTVVACDDIPDFVGRRVAVYLYSSCGDCRWCDAGRETLCPEAARPGIERDGGLAEYLAVDHRTLLSLRPSTDIAAAAVSMDAVLTPWGALVGKGRVVAGDRVVVIGCGGLGSNAVQIATSLGARVAVIDPQESQRQMGLELGAEIAIDPSRVSEIESWSNGRGGADVALETSGRRAGFDTAVASVGPAGRIVCNGYQPGTEYGLDSGRLVLEEISVLGSRVAGRGQARDALDAVEDGRVTPRIMDSFPLEKLGQALSLLRAGEVEGRLVLRPAEGKT